MTARLATTSAPKKGTVQEQLPQLFFEMGRLLKREMSRDGIQHDALSYLHMETMRYIEERTRAEGTPSMREVAVYLKIAPPSATALIDGLVRDGILERAPDPKDRRVVRLSVSKKGTKLMETMMQARAEAFSRVIENLSTKDCEELVRILSRITSTSV